MLNPDRCCLFPESGRKVPRLSTPSLAQSNATPSRHNPNQNSAICCVAARSFFEAAIFRPKELRALLETQ